ncbi:MAG: MASE4 domain-containing protein [Candidatus Rokuibacteriota bacterium]
MNAGVAVDPLSEARPTEDRGVLLSTLPAGSGERRLAITVVLLSVAAFLAAVPFATVRLPQVSAFIPIYQSAFVVSDLITAVLLFGQYTILRSRALLALATGYLFTALMAAAHGLTFPGLFAPTGLLGAGPQTTAWLYMFWHGGFPILVIVYAVLKDDDRETSSLPQRVGLAILSTIAAALVAAAAVTLLATAGQATLPAIMRGNHYTPAMIVVVSTVWVLSLVALLVLSRRRPPSVLDLWLMVVMVAWLFDIALAAVFNAGRFDLGFYTGRIYGLLAATFVLMLLLIEHTKLYARLVENLGEMRRLQRQLERQNEHLEEQIRARTRQLLDAEKLATMGNLLAGVAHELNNPLSIITGHVALLIEKAPDDSVRARGRKIEAAATRCVRIMKNFLAMARRRAPERQHVARNDLLREAVEILAYEFRVANIEVRLDLAEGLPLVWAEGHQLQQVAVNLLTNAHHALREAPPPRRLTVTTRWDDASGRVRIVIADTGPGIPADVQTRIFEPFFTTKPEGEGTGLGLPLCRGVVENHGGAIRVESVPGEGATFVIELPLGSPPASAAAPGDTQAAPVVSGKTILVVDDEPDVAGVLAEALARDGHCVDTAPNGQAALAKIDAREHDLIVSDCGMPVLGGMELYRELTRRDPRLANRLIFVSGDTLNKQATDFLESIGAPRLSKPFALEQIQTLVRHVLARS